SASELVINGMLPFYHANQALVGTNTYGKPVGQIAVDRAACDDRFRIIAFATENGAHQGTYFDGLAPKMDVTCQAGDDIARPMGDPLEGSTRAALDFLAGRSCTAIAAAPPSGAHGLPRPPRCRPRSALGRPGPAGAAPARFADAGPAERAAA